MSVLTLLCGDENGIKKNKRSRQIGRETMFKFYKVVAVPSVYVGVKMGSRKIKTSMKFKQKEEEIVLRLVETCSR
jgi:type IV secretory pathway VirB9-like protein